MMIRGQILTMVAFLSFIWGCSDAGNGASRRQKASFYDYYPSPIARTILSTNVVAWVNGAAITRADYDDEYRLRAISYVLCRGLSVSKREAKVDMYLQGIKEPLLLDLVRRELLRQACERRPVAVSEKSLSGVRRKFMKEIRKPSVSFDDFANELPKNVRAALVRHLADEARDAKFLTTWATNDLASVSVEEVSNRLVRLEKFQHDVESRNAEAKRKAAAAKAEILAGASFYSVTTNRAEIFKNQGLEWDTVELGELDEESDLFGFLASANAGDISDPLDLDDSIAIVGVVQKEMGEVPEGVKPAMQYTLVRCAFNAYEMPDEPTDFAGMRKFILDRRMASAREALVRALADEAKIEFPYGKGLFRQPPRKKKAAAGKRQKKAGVRKPKTGK